MKPLLVPLRASELWTRWLELAAESGLDAGDPADLLTAGLPDRGPLALHGVGTCAAALDALLGLARRRRPFARLEGAAIVVDPEGGDDSEATARALLALLRDRHGAARRARVVAEVMADRAMPRRTRLGMTRIARRWGLSRATVDRWCDEADQRLLAVASVAKTPANATCEPGIVLQDDDRPGRPVSSGRAIRRSTAA